jgi:hypothetical protein
MGYYTRVEGEIVITPPLTENEMTLVGVHPRAGWPSDRWIATVRRHNRNEEMDLAVRINVAEHANDERQLVKTITGVALVVAWEDEFKAYYLEEDLRSLVNTFPGHEFTGELRMEGEDNLDIWKLQVKDNVVEVIYPRLVWPDGTEETYPR